MGAHLVACERMHVVALTAARLCRRSAMAWAVKPRDGICIRRHGPCGRARARECRCTSPGSLCAPWRSRSRRPPSAKRSSPRTTSPPGRGGLASPPLRPVQVAWPRSSLARASEAAVHQQSYALRPCATQRRHSCQAGKGPSFAQLSCRGSVLSPPSLLQLWRGGRHVWWTAGVLFAPRVPVGGRCATTRATSELAPTAMRLGSDTAVLCAAVAEHSRRQSARQSRVGRASADTGAPGHSA